METIPEVASGGSEPPQDASDSELRALHNGEKEMSGQDETGDDVQEVQEEGSRKDVNGIEVEEKEEDDGQKCDEEGNEKEHGEEEEEEEEKKEEEEEEEEEDEQGGRSGRRMDGGGASGSQRQ